MARRTETRRARCLARALLALKSKFGVPPSGGAPRARSPRPHQRGTLTFGTFLTIWITNNENPCSNRSRSRRDLEYFSRDRGGRRYLRFRSENVPRRGAGLLVSGRYAYLRCRKRRPRCRHVHFETKSTRSGLARR